MSEQKKRRVLESMKYIYFIEPVMYQAGTFVSFGAIHDPQGLLLELQETLPGVKYHK